MQEAASEERGLSVRSIPSDAWVNALSHLGASDVASVSETCRGLAGPAEVVAACSRIGGETYEALLRVAGRESPRRRRSASEEGRAAASLSLRVLRTAELQKISDGLNRAQDDQGQRGYWLSKNWASHARRYCEAARAKLASHGGTPQGKRGRGRSRSSSSESLPPWPDANADLVCEHGALAPRSVPRAKRVLVDRAAWRAIASRFPLSTKFKASTAAECRACLAVLEDRHRQKAEERSRLECEKQRRLSELEDAPSPLLRALLSKDRAKRGVPPHRVSLEALAANGADAGVPPLALGRYHLVPRAWMQSWRASLRNPSAPRPGPPPTHDCLCVAHGRPLVSPDLANYLAGRVPALRFPKRTTASEILDAHEWAALNALFPVDFAVAFDVLPDHSANFLQIRWLTEPCRLCDANGTTQDLDLKFRPRDAKRLGKSRYHEDDACVF